METVSIVVPCYNEEENIDNFYNEIKEVVEAVLSLKEYNRFSKGIFTWVGFKTKYILIDNIDRTSGKTKWNFFKLFSLSSLERTSSITPFSLLFNSLKILSSIEHRLDAHSKVLTKYQYNKNFVTYLLTKVNKKSVKSSFTHTNRNWVRVR